MSDTQPKAGFPWMKVLLTLSLAGNLLVAGVVGGAFLGRGDREERPARVVRELGFGPYAMGFDRAQIKALEPALQDRRNTLRQNRLALRDGLDRALALLRTSPFDAAGFAAHLQAQGQRAAELQDIGQQVLADQIAGMTDAERAAFADRLEQGLQRFKRFKDRSQR